MLKGIQYVNKKVPVYFLLYHPALSQLVINVKLFLYVIIDYSHRSTNLIKAGLLSKVKVLNLASGSP